MLKCGCTIEGEYTRAYCPICGKYLRHSFLGEPSPQDSSIRHIMHKIYDNRKRIAGEFYELTGTATWESIADPIKKAHICFFDITGEIFNVAFELGYAMGLVISNWGDIKQRKKIVFLSNESPSEHILNIMDIKPSLPQTPTYRNLTRNYREGTDLEEASITAKSKIKAREKKITAVLLDEKFEDGVRHIFGPKEVWNWMKDREENILVLTTEDHISRFNGIDTSVLIESSTLSIRPVDTYFVPLGRMRDFLERITGQIIKEYDFLILHLLGNETDEVVNANEHNFKVGVIAGIMMGCREEMYEPNYFLAHENNPTTFLRCSDITPMRYTSLDNIVEVVNNRIIRERIIPQRI